jgi:hypothetical protein
MPQGQYRVFESLSIATRLSPLTFHHDPNATLCDFLRPTTPPYLRKLIRKCHCLYYHTSTFDDGRACHVSQSFPRSGWHQFVLAAELPYLRHASCVRAAAVRPPMWAWRFAVVTSPHHRAASLTYSTSRAFILTFSLKVQNCYSSDVHFRTLSATRART